jgi:hypothetical protein
LSSKAKNIEINEICGGDFEVNVINFVARYGNYTRKSPFITIHGAYTKYIEVMTDVTYISGLTGDSQIVPVTMFLVMLLLVSCSRITMKLICSLRRWTHSI